MIEKIVLENKGYRIKEISLGPEEIHKSTESFPRNVSNIEGFAQVIIDDQMFVSDWHDSFMVPSNHSLELFNSNLEGMVIFLIVELRRYDE